MKLKDSFMTQEVDDVQFLVPLGQEDFRGLVRSNPTAAFSVNCLGQETTAEEIPQETETPRFIFRWGT